MNFTGNENHQITLEEASALTARYRATANAADAKAEYFGKDALISLLSQNACVGVRIYYGVDENNVKKLVLVGVNAEGNDMCEGELMEKGTLCPPICSADNPLNT